MTTSHQKENTVATTKPALRAGALKPVLAGVGVTDLAVEAVRDAVADVQKRVAAVQKDVTGRVAGVQKPDVQASRAAIEARVAELQTEARAYPAKVSTQLASQLTSQLNQFSALVDENVAAASGTYADLVRRGESLVGRIRRQESSTATVSSAKTTVTKARTTATQAKRAAEANVEAADKTAATKVAPQSEPTAKKASRQAAGKKASATTARKTAARKTTTARSSAKATATAAQKTAANATQAAAEAAEKVGD